jgi:hypothetical protein
VRKLSFVVIALVASLGATAAVAWGNRMRPADTKLETLHSRFLLLRHGRPTKPPVEVTTGMPSAKYGLALSQAVVQDLPGGTTFWLIPGTQETCIAVVDPDVASTTASLEVLCQTDRSVLEHGEFVLIATRTHEYIFGVQPGDARTMTATTNAGHSTKVATLYGIYTFVTRRPTFIRTLNTPGGPTRLPPQHWLGDTSQASQREPSANR